MFIRKLETGERFGTYLRTDNGYKITAQEVMLLYKMVITQSNWLIVYHLVETLPQGKTGSMEITTMKKLRYIW